MHHFFAYLSRMKLIDRWSLMRCTQRENVQEHSLQVAVIAHALCLIKNRRHGGTTSAERVASIALFHDATEVMTGDLPTPVKYFNDEIREAYRALEGHAANQLLKLLPADLRIDYEGLLHPTDDDNEAWEFVKAADTICAFIKCLEEQAAGNREFERARKTIEEKLRQSLHRPEVADFVKEFIPGFSLTLDEISTEMA
jgi:5'-deoxynucleotidase